MFSSKRFELFSIYDFATLVFTAALCQIRFECTTFQMNCKKLFLNAMLYIIDLDTLFRISFETDSLYILLKKKKKVSPVLLLHFTIVCNIWLLSSGCWGALFFVLLHHSGSLVCSSLKTSDSTFNSGSFLTIIIYFYDCGDTPPTLKADIQPQCDSKPRCQTIPLPPTPPPKNTLLLYN